MKPRGNVQRATADRSERLFRKWELSDRLGAIDGRLERVLRFADEARTGNAADYWRQDRDRTHAHWPPFLPTPPIFPEAAASLARSLATKARQALRRDNLVTYYALLLGLDDLHNRLQTRMAEARASFTASGSRKTAVTRELYDELRPTTHPAKLAGKIQERLRADSGGRKVRGDALITIKRTIAKFAKQDR